jgi:hypothetical protein
VHLEKQNQEYHQRIFFKRYLPFKPKKKKKTLGHWSHTRNKEIAEEKKRTISMGIKIHREQHST